jgi:hypothetical protein
VEGIGFIKAYGGRRVEQHVEVDSFINSPLEDAEIDRKKELALGFEKPLQLWQAITPQLPMTWRAHDWASRPVRFVDGKDVGYTVISLPSADGHILPVRLAEIGGVAMRVVDGEMRREFVRVERVVSMITSAYPWDEMESFATALQKHQLRLLPVRPQEEKRLLDFSRMEQATRDRSRVEMILLEEMAIAQDDGIPTVVDGRLAQHDGGFDLAHSPVFGVIKNHHQTYLHRLGQQILYQLTPGQRTPAFIIRPAAATGEKFPVVSWYVRLCNDEYAPPNHGIVRVEVALKWFDGNGYCDGLINSQGVEFINQLSRTVYEYRCRESSYWRAATSLHPIVRAEESLGSLFSPMGVLRNNFYRLMGV